MIYDDEYEAVIGLEVHVQVRTASKMFCGCPNRYGGEPNTQVCPVCLGYPGVLPTPNREAIIKTIRAGMMIDCTIPNYAKFDRKSYFYPDMPKNYQITQYDLPFCVGGHVTVSGKSLGGDVPETTLGVTRIHLEEDVAKSTHESDRSLIDFNRAGVPLMEIVSEPDMRSPDQAYLYLVALKQVMQYADISDCDMEKGQMRCDVNISVRPVGQPHFNNKTELKNLNSFKAVHRGIEYEIERQIDLLDEGETLRQTTRGWNDDRGESYHMRDKEGDADYRYFPEPDMMPIELSDERIAEIRATLPSSPAARRASYVADHGLSDYDAHVLTLERLTADYFDAVIATGADAKKAANWITNDLNRELAAAGQSIDDCRVTPTALAELIKLVDGGAINSKIARDVFAILIADGGSPAAIVEEKGWKQESDSGAIEALVDQVIAANPGPADEYRAGQAKALNFLVGQVMKLSKGKANPQQTRDMIQAKLG